MDDLIDKRTESLLTRPEFQGLAEIPPAIEWFANIENHATQRAYRADIQDFCMFVGLQRPDDMRLVTRAHVIAWHDRLKARDLAKSTIRRKLAALSSLFGHLAERNAVADNPVNGVQRPKAPAGEGLTPRISDDQAKRLIEAPSPTTLKGKGDRIRFIPAHPLPVRLIRDYLEEAGHGDDHKGPLFRPLSRNLGDAAPRALAPHSIARDVVAKYARETGIAEETIGVSPHAMRVTAVSNARDHGADLDDLQHWAGHANISTTRLYIRRQAKPEDSPTFKVRY